jgi:pimeloyl-ACP methyl ester carboxylesterase
MTNATIKETRFRTNGIELSGLEAGPIDGPLVVMLHGFPEIAWSWRHHVDVLAARGFHVVAPDMRGYNDSDKPKGLRAYHLDELANDVVGLADHFGVDRFQLVGHDWGAAVAWWVGLQHPERLARLVCLNVPHPRVMERHLRGDLEQMRRSWYIAFFQLPVLPERVLTRGSGRILQKTSNPGSFSDDDLAHYRAAWRKPGAATAMLNYYRAIRFFPRPKNKRVQAPTLVIWGAKDHALKKEMAAESVAQCDDGRLELIDDATHWVQHDAKDRVATLLAEFLDVRVAGRASSSSTAARA